MVVFYVDKAKQMFRDENAVLKPSTIRASQIVELIIFYKLKKIVQTTYITHIDQPYEVHTIYYY